MLKKFKKEIQKRNSKYHEQFLENDSFVHWASFDCKEGLSLTEPRYEK